MRVANGATGKANSRMISSEMLSMARYGTRSNTASFHGVVPELRSQGLALTDTAQIRA